MAERRNDERRPRKESAAFVVSTDSHIIPPVRMGYVLSLDPQTAYEHLAEIALTTGEMAVGIVSDRSIVAGPDVILVEKAAQGHALPPCPRLQREDGREVSLFALPEGEVEAIDAPVLRELVSAAITSHIDPDQLRITQMVEESERQGLLAMARGWSA